MRDQPLMRKRFYQEGSIHCEDHLEISSKIGANAQPFSVKEYSMRTGVSGMTSRLITPSVSSSFSLSDRTLPLKFGSAASISPKAAVRSIAERR